MSKKNGVEIDGQKISGKIIFGPKNFGQNNFGVKKCIESKKYLLRKFWVRKIYFWLKRKEITNFLGKKKLFCPNIFVREIIFDHQFLHQIFLTNSSFTKNYF